MTQMMLHASYIPEELFFDGIIYLKKQAKIVRISLIFSAYIFSTYVLTFALSESGYKTDIMNFFLMRTFINGSYTKGNAKTGTQ